MKKRLEKATFAGGCFWCMVKPFDQWDGVESVISGYTGGHVENPVYEEVKKGTTGHYEAIQITYEPEKISYQQILDLYWPQIDPTDDGGQFHDRGGAQYRTAIFYHNEKQKELAIDSKEALEDTNRFQKEIVTEILPADTFYPAETYHQEFYKKNEKEYTLDREQSGRDEFIERYWESL
ncbi:peptide methionine sulfoxide reductase MsrA [Gracilibacillus boraciitolerans JCM 21714]|uniref:Peptide methionine sulfoxide reductase MsrA n=1 Tax=Gracilibacillus boraciitolerans JCM 21714 TaxID=1298598 RepID=W4VE88_9BACI|nr:peptide-methionine (S)-S-oxide reductase MsrA [Gracilibacillus boraciitolerans]GAE91476.1 peptide methionine sulfoxide reductase MsrA [Gracilibacillus boraciitolerans JCM 21714]